MAWHHTTAVHGHTVFDSVSRMVWRCHFVGDRPGFSLQPPGSLLACAGPHRQPRGLLLAAFVVQCKGSCCTRLCTVQDCRELAGESRAASAHRWDKVQPVSRQAMQGHSEAGRQTTTVPSKCLCRCGPPAGCWGACAGHGRVWWAIGLRTGAPPCGTPIHKGVDAPVAVIILYFVHSAFVNPTPGQPTAAILVVHPSRRQSPPPQVDTREHNAALEASKLQGRHTLHAQTSQPLTKQTGLPRLLAAHGSDTGNMSA